MQAKAAADAQANSIPGIPDGAAADRIARSYGAFRDARLLPDDEATKLLAYPYQRRDGKWLSIVHTVEFFQVWRYDSFFTDPTAARRYIESVDR